MACNGLIKPTNAGSCMHAAHACPSRIKMLPHACISTTSQPAVSTAEMQFEHCDHIQLGHTPYKASVAPHNLPGAYIVVQATYKHH